MASLGDAITYPTKNDEWLKIVIVGGLLTVFGFLVVPLILVYGYVVRTVRERLNGNPEPPRFDEWTSLFVDGLQALVIGFVYLLVPMVVGWITVGVSIGAMATGSRTGAMAGIASMFGGLAITFVLALVFGYVAVAAIVTFAREERFGAAFDFAVLREVLGSGEFAMAWVASIVVFVVAGIVASVLNALPLLGLVLGSFVFFYAEVVAAGLWADGYRRARTPADEVGRVESEEPTF